MNKKRNVENNDSKEEGKGNVEKDEKKIKFSEPILIESETSKMVILKKKKNSNKIMTKKNDPAYQKMELIPFNQKNELIALNEEGKSEEGKEEDEYHPNLPLHFLPLFGKKAGTMFFFTKFAPNLDLESYTSTNLIIEGMSENLSLFLVTSPKEAKGNILSNYKLRSSESIKKEFSRVKKKERFF
jgi:dsDNA-binding SOS-regulon protein